MTKGVTLKISVRNLLNGREWFSHYRAGEVAALILPALRAGTKVSLSFRGVCFGADSMEALIKELYTGYNAAGVDAQLRLTGLSFVTKRRWAEVAKAGT